MAPEPEDALLCLLVRLGPADPDLSVPRAIAAAGAVLLDGFLVRLGGDECVTRATCQLSRFRPGRRDGDRDRMLGQRVERRVVDRVVLAAVGLLAAVPEEADHLDRLLEHLDPLVGRGPAGARDVLVQVLTCTEPEREPARQHRADGSGGLRDDRRMRPDQRARDAGRKLDPLGCLRDPAQHAPDERTLTLGLDPGMEVVGDHREGEAQLLRPRGVADEVERFVLLGGEPVAELRHGALGTARLDHRNPR